LGTNCDSIFWDPAVPAQVQAFLLWSQWLRPLPGAPCTDRPRLAPSETKGAQGEGPQLVLTCDSVSWLSMSETACRDQAKQALHSYHCSGVFVWQKSSIVNTKGKLRHLEVVQLKEPPQKNSVVPWRLKQRGTTWSATSTAWRHCANREKQRDWNCCRSGKSSSRNRRAIMSVFILQLWDPVCYAHKHPRRCRKTGGAKGSATVLPAWTLQTSWKLQR